MKTIQEILFKKADIEDIDLGLEYSLRHNEMEYEDLLSGFEFEILVHTKEDNWQGNYIIVFKDDIKYGILNWYFGSCSGCDALYACYTIEEYEKLYNELFNGIKWYKNKKDLDIYISEHDWGGDCVDKDLVSQFKENYAKL